MCVESAQPARINAVILRGGGPVRVVRVEYGRDHLGRWMEPDAERVLARSIYRRLEEASPAPEPTADSEAVSRIIETVCAIYGVTPDQLFDTSIRRKVVKHARAQAAHTMKRTLNLSEKSISKILNFKHKSCVVYWLSIPEYKIAA